MLKPEQVPKEAADALQKLISRGVFTSTEEAIAAAINAWPGMMFNDAEMIDGDLYPPIVYLVIRQETRDE